MATAALDPAIAAVLKRPFPEQVAFFRGKLAGLFPPSPGAICGRESTPRH